MDQQKIHELIETKREGPYWDFKREHHENMADLLHDILCLANSRTKCSKFIIYGVSDPAENCEVVGISQKDRRTQAQIIDFLRTQKFAGDRRPEIELRKCYIKNIEIDVLEIFDHPEKPYYLTEEYKYNPKNGKPKMVRAFYIYSRIGDTNIPIDQCADLLTIEALWRERFGLDLQPAQMMIKLLKEPENWEKDIGNEEYAYHKYHCEYRVHFGETTSFQDVYSFFYHNEKSFCGKASFKYLDTKLFDLGYVYADEMRVVFPDPGRGLIRVDADEIGYQYFIIESRQGAFLRFLTDGTMDLQSKLSSESFILFKNKEEKGAFERFVQDNIERFYSLEDPKIGLSVQSRIDNAEKDFYFKPVQMIKLSRLFHAWKEEVSIGSLES